jgi:transcription elongation factor/antiterminator RfaH
MSAWCVVNTLPHQEKRAEANLLRQGFRAWLPAIWRSRRHARRLDTVRAPMFPGYLFVLLDLERESWGPINNSYGVRRLLTREARPEALPEDFVTGLRSSVVEDGTCTLAPVGEDLRPGSRVRIVSGPFAEQIAITASLAPGDRVKLLLDILGGKVRTTMSRFSIVLEG